MVDGEPVENQTDPFLSAALQRFHPGGSTRLSSAEGAGADSRHGSTIAQPLQHSQQSVHQHHQRRHGTRGGVDKDVLLHSQLLRGLHNVWNHRPAESYEPAHARKAHDLAASRLLLQGTRHASTGGGLSHKLHSSEKMELAENEIPNVGTRSVEPEQSASTHLLVEAELKGAAVSSRSK